MNKFTYFLSDVSMKTNSVIVIDKFINKCMNAYFQEFKILKWTKSHIIVDKFVSGSKILQLTFISGKIHKARMTPDETKVILKKKNIFIIKKKNRKLSKIKPRIFLFY